MNARSSNLRSGDLRPSSRRGKIALGWLALALPVSLLALDPAKTIFQFDCQNWNREAGLPADRVMAIAQSPAGYIWLGTQNGLIRFDGLEFKSVPVDLPEAQGQDVQRIELGADGRMWFSISHGGYGSFDERTFSAVGDPRWTAPGMNASTIHVGRDGAIWTGTVYGWGRWMPGKPEQTFFDDKLGSPLVIAEDASGRVWMGMAERGLFYWSSGQFVLFPDEDLKKENIYAIAVDAGGDIWVGTGRGLRRYGADYHLKNIYFPTGQTNALLIDSHGVLWIGTRDTGLGRYENGEFTFLRKSDGLGSDSITSLFEDREGSLWMGNGNGFSQLSDIKFPIYSKSDGLINDLALTVAAAPGGGVWISTAGGASYFDGKTFLNYNDDALLPNHYVRRIFAASNGDVYLADGNKNINVLSGGRLSVRYVNDSWPEAFVEDEEGVIGGIGPKLVRFVDGKIQPFAFDGPEPDLNWVNNLCLARDGALWAATNNGLFRIEHGKFERWSIANGLSADRVHCVFEDPDGSIWAGLPTGMVRIKDRVVRNVTMGDGLPDGRVYAIVPGDHGYFWVDSGRGIFRVARASLNALIDGKLRQVECDDFDGLESVRFSDRAEQGFSGAKTTDGRIWFPNPHGVVMIDSAHYFTNKIPPQTHIEKVVVDGRELDAKNFADLRVGDRRVEFFFSALSYIAPTKVHVRYQLSGFDRTWIDAGSHRSVIYNHLDPGHYTFALQAANADGVWNSTSETFAIQLPPPFYKTLWFYGVCSLGGVVLLAGGYRWKVRHMKVLQKKLEAQNDLLETKVGQRTDELAGSLSLLRATLDSTADGILAVHFSGEVVSYNSQFVAMWGIPPGMLEKGVDADIQAFTATRVRDARQFVARLEQMRADPEAETFDTIELKDGRIFERYGKPQRIDGRSVGVVRNFRDITERKRSEAAIAEASNLLESFLKHSIDFIYFKDRESRFVRYSDTLLQHFNVTGPDGLKGKTDFDCHTEARARDAYADEQEVLRTGRPLVAKLEKETGVDGRAFWYLTTKMPWRDRNGEIIGTFGISRDVSALKKTEEKLEQVHQQLIETSRQAGMAEVATSVLHNVGNVLNSVNVSATLVSDVIRGSKLDNVAKIGAMLGAHAADLGAFFTTDPKGRKVPAYIVSLGEDLLVAQASIIEELGHLRKNIEHIKEIVTMQQSYARVSGVAASLPLVDIMEEALRINSSALTRHEVELVRDYAARPTVLIEKHKLLQVLVNLIRNAKYACDDSGRTDKRITMRITQDAERFKIAVIDNGVGIPPENITRIFAHGFTTRKEGHGFGLHSGALVAKELGGSLVAQSDGPGRGAVFTLDLPLGTGAAAAP